jgi:hypothetical protein
MSTRLDGAHGPLVAALWWERAPAGRRLRFADEASLLRCVDGLIALDRAGRLARVVAEAGYATRSHSNDELRARLAACLARGALRLIAVPPRPLSAPALTRAEAERSEEVPRPEVEHWIEIVLVDDEGAPVAGERYRVELPNGEIREGRLGVTGKARLSGIDPGRCKVTFPLREPSWWFPAPDERGPAPRPLELEGVEPTFPEAAALDLEVVEDEGVPVAGEPFVLTSPEGRRYRGELDEHGAFHWGPVAPGRWQVEFPGRRGEAWWSAGADEPPPRLGEVAFAPVTPYWPGAPALSESNDA